MAVNMKTYYITPVPKPRQTRSDVWKQRDCVMRYRRFADEARQLKIHVPESGAWVKFYLPMPAGWSKKQRENMNGQAHQKTPDLDNLLKSLLDALFIDDQHIHDIRISKFWNETGMIIIE